MAASARDMSALRDMDGIEKGQRKEKDAMIDYPKIYRRIYSSRVWMDTLRHLDRLIVLFISVAFVTYLAFYFFFHSPLEAILYMMVSGVPLLAVTLMRRYFDFKRPYEVYDFEAMGITPPSSKMGKSFPSRHAFSAFLIGTLMIELMLPLGVVILVLALLMSVARVLLGLHFLRDVAVGAALGVAMGVFGILAIVLI